MPIYEYVCQGCGKRTEAIQKFSDPPFTECLDCHGDLKKVISRTSFQLKGGGWYATDYKKSSGGPTATANATDNTATITANSPKKDATSDKGTPADKGPASTSTPTPGTPSSPKKAE